MAKKALFLIFLFLLVFSPISAQTLSTVVAIEKTDVSELRRQSFERVWNTVNEKHFDPTFGGVDWKRIGDKYKPQAMAAKTDDDFHGILQKMLGELNQSHFGVFPANSEITASSFGEGEIGIDVQIINRQAVITQVDANSSAEKSGLKTGFVIRKINDKTPAEMLVSVESKLKNRQYTEARKVMYRERTLLYAISGKAESFVKLEVLDGENQPQTFEVKREAYTGEMSAPLGNFESQRVIFEGKTLSNNIAYIRFNIWVIPQMSKIREAVGAMKNSKGIIFDLRGNPGGVGLIAVGVAGLLVKENTSLGTMKSRDSETKFAVHPQKDPFSGKVIILTDSGTGSTSEIFAAGMQEIGRAKIVGEMTAGAVLPSVFEKLPTGALFQYAIADYRSPKKILIEGRGVTPDIEVKLTRQSLLEGRDLQLERAITEILRGK